jgi:hypothetical protein
MRAGMNAAREWVLCSSVRRPRPGVAAGLAASQPSATQPDRPGRSMGQGLLRWHACPGGVTFTLLRDLVADWLLAAGVHPYTVAELHQRAGVPKA